MTEYSHKQKLISRLMIFILLVCLSCSTYTRIISKSEITSLNNNKYTYIVHGERLKLLLEQLTISNDTLSGKIKQTYPEDFYVDNSNYEGNLIHLYLLSDSVVKIDNKGDGLSVPLDGIAQVSLQEVEGLSSYLIGFGSALLMGLVAILILSALNY